MFVDKWVAESATCCRCYYLASEMYCFCHLCRLQNFYIYIVLKSGLRLKSGLGLGLGGFFSKSSDKFTSYKVIQIMINVPFLKYENATSLRA